MTFSTVACGAGISQVARKPRPPITTSRSTITSALTNFDPLHMLLDLTLQRRRLRLPGAAIARHPVAMDQDVYVGFEL